MVKTRQSSHAQINKDKLADALGIFGRTNLVLRVVTETVDDYGQLSARSYADTTFTGDLQFGPDLDERFINIGMVDVGDAVLYIHPTNSGLTTLPKPEDIIVESSTSSKWEIHSQIEAPELGGTVCHYSYRCKRLVESGDQSQ
jgi:hypothetical protein